MRMPACYPGRHFLFKRGIITAGSKILAILGLISLVKSAMFSICSKAAMKKRVFSVLILLCVFLSSSFAQGDRGGTVTNVQPAAPTGRVYALIVGVSKYNEVTSLKYANRDALAFADYLKSKAGGNVDPANIKIFTDEEATRANIFDELYYLKQTAQPGDLMYFYFAGHGDIEQDLSEGEDALLLLSKSFKKNYLSGSEYIELDKLRSIIGNFAKKGVNVIFVADACHSGAMLSGGQSGKERTLTALQESWGNEVKFLSCQPNEVSEENPKWGGGRGIFSFTLEEGLKGLADTNGDSIVTVGEIKRYLDNEVPKQTGDAQNPDVRGDLKKPLARVDVATMLALKEQKQKQLPEMIAMNTGGRSAEDNLLVGASKEVVDIYKKFKAAMDSGTLVHQEGNVSAYDYFLQLQNTDASAELKRIVKRNFVSALQDGTMIFIQSQLSGKKDVDGFNEKVEKEQMDKWNNSITQLNAAVTILGPDHYLTPSYTARKLYLEAYILYYNLTTYKHKYTRENRDSCIAKLEDAVKLEENASYAYYLLGEVYSYCGKNALSRQAYEKYLRLNPKDGYAFVNLAGLARREQNLVLADSLIQVALKVGSNQMAEFIDNVGDYYYIWDDYDNAMKFYKKSIEMNPTLVGPYLNMGVISKTNKDYKNAAYYYGKVLQYDSTYAWAYNNLANIYAGEKNYAKAIDYYNRAIKLDSNYHMAYSNLAISYEGLKQYDTALKLLHLSKSLEMYDASTYYSIAHVHYNKKNYDSSALYYYYCTLLDSTDAKSYYWMGRSYEKQGDTMLARLYYNQAGEIDTTYADPWEAIADLYYNDKNYSEAALWYALAVSKDTLSADQWFYMGRAYYYADSTALAEKIFRKKVLKLDSNYKAVYVQLGNIFYDRSVYDSAEYYYKRAIKIDSAYTVAHYNLGLVHEMRTDYDKAIKSFRSALKYDTAYYSALNALGDEYRLKEKYDSAAKYYNFYLQRDTAFSRKTLNNLATVYDKMGDTVKAINSYKKILSRQQDVDAAFSLGDLYYRYGNYAEAKVWYARAEGNEDYKLALLYRYASLEEVAGNYEQAATIFKEALKIDSANPYGLTNYGRVVGVYLKKPAEAQPYVQKAAELDTANYFSSYFNLAYNYYLSGDLNTSAVWFEKSVTRNPHDFGSTYNLACIYSIQKNNAKALKYLDWSFKEGYTDFEHVKADTDLDNIRNLPEFAAIITKYKKGGK